MEEKIVKVGIFWVIPDKITGPTVIEFKKSFYISEADGNGFINYPYSHYEVWDDDVKGLGDDCYKYPRGRVIYDAKRGKHRIFADECVWQSTIDEIAQLFEIEDYELCRDEHYVCKFCSSCKHSERATLKYKILRGKDRIGENLIEISYGDTKILTELGKALDGGDEFSDIEKTVLKTKYDAVVVSHYHGDHAGLIWEKDDCPIYIGGGAWRVLSAINCYLGKDVPDNVKTYRNNKPFKIGGIKVTPYLCDHSAFDSYILLFEAGGQSILYTGDFRFHGRKDKDKLLSALPKSVDVLIHEGTNTGKNACTMTEAELEDKAFEIMRGDGPVFVLQSSTNIDRLVSIYRASKKSGRLVYMDNFTSLIASAAGGSIPRPDVFGDVVAFTPVPVRGSRKDMFFEIENKRGLNGISNGTRRFTMFVRPAMLNYVKKLFAVMGNPEAKLIYSVWKGYKDETPVKEFLEQMMALGVVTVDLHTSGHASEGDIALLKRTVEAKETVCVHTEHNS